MPLKLKKLEIKSLNFLTWSKVLKFFIIFNCNFMHQSQSSPIPFCSLQVVLSPRTQGITEGQFFFNSTSPAPNTHTHTHTHTLTHTHTHTRGNHREILVHQNLFDCHCNSIGWYLNSFVGLYKSL